MRKFYSTIVKGRKLFITLFLILAAVCAVMQRYVAVNYDMNEYLPKGTASTIAAEVLAEQFPGVMPNARVMVKDVSIPEALGYKKRLESLPGVEEVLWLDDAADITVPEEMIEKSGLDMYYKNRAALFSVAVNDSARGETVKEIRAIIGDGNHMSGSAVITAVATEDTVAEVGRIAVFAVLFAFFVLLLTTRSWLEPVIVLAGLGVAVIINMGTNLFFGEISFVTNAAGSILQLGVSLDYTVFLLHRFNECREKADRADKSAADSMIDALCKSTASILSSGLTTVIGFLALTLMKFRIGPDLGFTLAKGIAISLVTVFIFMPGFILAVHKLLDKTEHKLLVPSFGRLGHVVQKFMLVAAVLFFAVMIPSYLASGSNYFLYGASRIYSEKTTLGADIKAIEDIYGKSDTYVLIVPKKELPVQKELSEKIKKLPAVTGVISYALTVGTPIPAEFPDKSQIEKLMSGKYSRIIVTAAADSEGREAFGLVGAIRSLADEYYPGEYYLAGQGASTYDLMVTITQDMVKVNLIAIGAVFLVLIFTMRSLILPVILVLCIETAIWINLSIPYFTDSPVFYIAYLIISAVQLGATVDYAILFTDRYVEFRKNADKRQALTSTVRTVTVSVLTSASALTVVGFLLGFISTHGLLSQLGMFLGIGTLVSVTIVMFVLPALLFMSDRIIMKKHRALKK